MLVNWTKTGPWCIARPKHQVGETPIILMPGVNSIPNKDWDLIKDYKLVKLRVDESELVLLNDKDGSEVTGDKALECEEAVELAGMNVKDATAVIKQTFSHALLERWAQQEHRKSLARIIEKQLKSIGPTAVKKDPTEDDE